MPQTLSSPSSPKNEEANLARTLASVRFAVQIVCWTSDRPTAPSRSPRSERSSLRGAVGGFAAAPRTRPSQMHRHMGPLARRRRGTDPRVPNRDSCAAVFRTLPPTRTSSADAISSSPLDQTRRILSRSKLAPLPPPPRPVSHAAAASRTAPSTRPSPSTAAPVRSTHDLLHTPTRRGDYIEHMDRYSTLAANCLSPPASQPIVPAFVCNVCWFPKLHFCGITSSASASSTAARACCFTSTRPRTPVGSTPRHGKQRADQRTSYGYSLPTLPAQSKRTICSVCGHKVR